MKVTGGAGAVFSAYARNSVSSCKQSLLDPLEAREEGFISRHA